MDAIKSFINIFADPRLFFILSVAALALIVWKREVFARNAVGYGLMAVLAVFFGFGLFDENFVLIIAKPDNVPIVALIFLVIFFTWYSMREAVLNDRRVRRPATTSSRSRNRIGSGSGPTWCTRS